MTAPGTATYLFVVVGGVILLGIAMAFGIVRNRQRTGAEKREEDRERLDL